MTLRSIKRDAIAKETSENNAKSKVTEGHKGKKAGPEWSWYVSAKEEVMAWDIKVTGEICKGIWDSDREYVTWRVPIALAPKFEAHHHVVMGRIIKSTK